MCALGRAIIIGQTHASPLSALCCALGTAAKADTLSTQLMNKFLVAGSPVLAEALQGQSVRREVWARRRLGTELHYTGRRLRAHWPRTGLLEP